VWKRESSVEGIENKNVFEFQNLEDVVVDYGCARVVV